MTVLYPYYTLSLSYVVHLLDFLRARLDMFLAFPFLTPHSNMAKQENHVSNETEPGCLGLKGDCTILLCGDYKYLLCSLLFGEDSHFD